MRDNARAPRFIPAEGSRGLFVEHTAYPPIRLSFDRLAPSEQTANLEASAKAWPAGTAPSGANRQPWRFVIVWDPDVKRRIRHAAEREEREFYETRAPEEWVAALHLAGLATLTHTPSPMGFLAAILDRPRNERPFLLIPVGYPAADAVVPMITKKALDSIRLEV